MWNKKRPMWSSEDAGAWSARDQLMQRQLQWLVFWTFLFVAAGLFVGWA